jgi:arylsulfatase A-like enzyme
VVFILADDLGYSDTTLYGMTRLYETPNIQRLAERGMLFTQAYAASPMCSATRASILTGQAPGRLGLTGAGGHLERVAESARRLTTEERQGRPRLRNKRALIARAATRLPSGIETLASALRRHGYATGHFGKWHLGSEPHSPLDFGFDVDVPHTHRAAPGTSYLAPWGMPELSNFRPRAAGEHLEARMADEAVAFMRAHRDRPFFLNYWAFSVHEPYAADPAREARYANKIDRRSPHASATYAAMVDHFDEAVGVLLDALDEFGLADDTVIVFTSDNGGSTYNHHRGLPVTSNLPLRGGKAHIYEGGTRVPAAVVWPGHVTPGSRSDALLDSTDWYPTLLDLLGKAPEPGQIFDGVSQREVLQGGRGSRDAIHVYLPHYFPIPGTVPASSIRIGALKLIRFHFDGEGQRDRFELYDLSRDPGERRNLAAKRPRDVERLNGELSRYFERIGALLPEANPLYVPTEGGVKDSS